MKRTLVAVLLVISFLIMLVGGCEIVSVIGSNTLETKDMEYSDFSSLRISHAFQVTVTRADTFSVSITADDNLFDFLNVKKVGNTLYIGLRPGTYIRTTQRATIEMPDLKDLTLSGASSADVSGFQSSNSTRFSLSGASRLELDGMKTGNSRFSLSGASRVTGNIDMMGTSFELSGASNLELHGSAGDITVDASGASRVVADELSAGDITVNLSGASSAVINAGGTIEGSLSGASSLRYVDSPNLGKFSTSGGSTVAQK